MKTYIAIDGDGVGSRLGELVQIGASDDVISNYATGVADEMRRFADRCKNVGGEVLLCSGDSVLVSCPSGITTGVIRGLKECRRATYSCGTGRTIKEAALNLQYAKVNGKNQTWHWQKSKPFWLKIRIESPLSVFSKYASGHF